MRHEFSLSFVMVVISGIPGGLVSAAEGEGHLRAMQEEVRHNEETRSAPATAPGPSPPAAPSRPYGSAAFSDSEYRVRDRAEIGVVGGILGFLLFEMPGKLISSGLQAASPGDLIGPWSGMELYPYRDDNPG